MGKDVCGNRQKTAENGVLCDVGVATVGVGGDAMVVARFGGGGGGGEDNEEEGVEGVEGEGVEVQVQVRGKKIILDFLFLCLHSYSGTGTRYTTFFTKILLYPVHTSYIVHAAAHVLSECMRLKTHLF